jgi:hypothetical protein
MIESMYRVTLPVAFACCVLAGCRPDDGSPPDDTARALPDSVSADSVFTPASDIETLPSSRIYYTLTSFDWYARGEPLVHDSRAWEPEGTPISASLADMARAGEYQGVEYYVRSGDPDPVVYVPVYDGYWQRFRADPSAVAMPRDAAGDAAPADSGPGRP